MKMSCLKEGVLKLQIIVPGTDRIHQLWCSGDPGYKGCEAQNQNGKHITKVPVNMIEQKGHMSNRC